MKGALLVLTICCALPAVGDAWSSAPSISLNDHNTIGRMSYERRERPNTGRCSADRKYVDSFVLGVRRIRCRFTQPFYVILRCHGGPPCGQDMRRPRYCQDRSVTVYKHCSFPNEYKDYIDQAGYHPLCNGSGCYVSIDATYKYICRCGSE